MLRKLPPGAYWSHCAALPDAGRYVAPGDPDWDVDEYNRLTGENALREDFPITAPEDEPPVIGDAA